MLCRTLTFDDIQTTSRIVKGLGGSCKRAVAGRVAHRDAVGSSCVEVPRVESRPSSLQSADHPVWQRHQRRAVLRWRLVWWFRMWVRVFRRVGTPVPVVYEAFNVAPAAKHFVGIQVQECLLHHNLRTKEACELDARRRSD